VTCPTAIVLLMAFILGQKFNKNGGPEGKRFGDAYALTCAQTGEVLKSLHEQDPGSGFRTVDDLERYMYLQFGINPSIIHDALLMGIESNNDDWFTRDLKEYIDRLVSPRRKAARMERIIAKKNDLLSRDAGMFGNRLFAHSEEPDDWEIERPVVRPAVEHVHFYYVCPTEQRGLIRQSYYQDQILITDCNRYSGQPSLQRREVGRIVLISGGRDLATPVRFVVDIPDPWE
jgi:hypothetical protein